MARRPFPTNLTINPEETGGPSTTLDSVPSDLLTITVGGKDYLLITTGHALVGFEVEPDGTLTLIPDFNYKTDAYRLASVLLEDGSAMIYALENDQIRYLSIDTDGKHDFAVENVPDDVNRSLQNATDITVVEIGSQLALAVVSPVENGVSLFGINKDGTLGDGENLVDGDELNNGHILDFSGARALAVTEVDDGVYLYVAATEDDAITGLPLGFQGPISPALPVLIDDETLPLAGVYDIETVEMNGEQYLIASSPAENAVSIYGIGKGGVLTLVDTFDDLFAPQDLATMEIDGTIYIAVTQGIGLLSKSAIPLTDDGVGFSLFILDENANFVRVAAVDTNIDTAAPIPPSLFEIDGEPFLFAWGDEENDLFALIPPVIDTTPMTVEVSENTTPVVGVPTLGAGSVVYSLGGADAALFTIDTGGDLSFINAPDYENPGDAGRDNVYDVEVTATNEDGGQTKEVTVEVTNVVGETILGTKKKDKLNGTGEEDTILGKNGKDNLKGFAGGDLLDGGKKKDKLTGGEDADQFRFSTKLKDKWADKIRDFEVGEDTILLDAGIFKKLGGPGALDADAFAKGKKAKSGDDRILHHKKSGNLLYDKDGKGGKDAIKFAKVDKGLNLSADDVWVV